MGHLVSDQQEYSAVGDTDSVSYGKPASLTARSTLMVTFAREFSFPYFSMKMNDISFSLEVKSMQDKITIYCKKCKKSTRVSHVLTGNDDTLVLPNVQIACMHCTRVITFKKLTEGEIKMKAKGDRFYI